MAKSRINAKEFNLKDFFSNKEEVQTGEMGEITRNRWTQESYRNCKKSNFIEVNAIKNTIGIMFPENGNKTILCKIAGSICQKYHMTPNTEYCEKTSLTGKFCQKEEYIQLVAFLPKITKSDIGFFIGLGEYVKSATKQETIAINVNSALCLV